MPPFEEVCITRARHARDSPDSNAKKTFKIGNNDNKNGNNKNNGKDKNSKLPYNIEVGESEGLTDGT